MMRLRGGGRMRGCSRVCLRSDCDYDVDIF
jgi:hypothetical protein